MVSHLRPRTFHMFYKYTTGITYITESGRTKYKQGWILIRPKRKKREILALFWHSVAIVSVYPKENPTPLPGTLTHPLTLDWPGFWVHSSQLLLQQPPLSLTVAFTWLSLTPICWLLGDLAFPRLLPVSLEISRASLLYGLRAKTDEEILRLALIHTQRTNTHHIATDFSLAFDSIQKGKTGKCF